MEEKTRSLGSILVEKGLLAADALTEALQTQEACGRRLGEVLVEKGLLGEVALRWALAEQLDLPLVHPDPKALDPEALSLISAEVCRRYGVLPLHLSPEAPGGDPILTVAAADPTLRRVLDDVAVRAGHPVRVVAALREEIDAALAFLYGPAPATAVEVRSAELSQDCLDEVLKDPTGTALMRRLLETLLNQEGTLLFFRAGDGEARVEDSKGRRLFVGGETWHTILLDRLRLLAGLPGRGLGILQRGRFTFPAGSGGEPVLFRVSLLKGIEGEEAQVKSLRLEGRVRSLPELGLTSHQCLEVRRALAKPGLVWVSAPGEEGLGSTLFGLLREVSGKGRTLTIEEEVFYRTPEFLQLETLDLDPNERTEVLRELKYLNFSRILIDRASPAQLGELLALAVRKRWVMAGSAEANLEGTLAGLAARAADVPLYGLSLVVHQRLVPLLCPQCRAEAALGTAEKQALDKFLPSRSTVYQEGEGCEACGGRGTRGARVFFEVLPVDASIREALYGEGGGEKRIPSILARVQPSIAGQVADAVARADVSLTELWDYV